MMKRMMLLLVMASGCAEAVAERAPPVRSEPDAVTPAASRPITKLRDPVEMVAVTLADDCGPAAAPSAPRDARARGLARRCEQTSMQLSIKAAPGAKVVVRSVELLDDKGASLGKLTASKPRIWSADKGVYEAWNGAVVGAEPNNVTYELSTPNWKKIDDRMNREFVVKAVLVINGTSTTLSKTASVSATTSLPPNVRT